MKRTIFNHATLLFLITVLITTSVCTSCKYQERANEIGMKDIKEVRFKENYLYVERQETYLDWNVSITMDIPIDVKHEDKKYESLQDSVSSFLNREAHSQLSRLCNEAPDIDETDYEYDVCNPFYSLNEILSVYQGRVEDVGYERISFFIIAQTESFVTYGLEEYHCAGSCGSDFHCYTFNKKDGRLVKDMITFQDIRRFVKDHPKSNHPFDQWKLEGDDKNIKEGSDYGIGLLNDGLLLVNENFSKHYFLGKIEYEDILPYLSEEAQGLVKAMGDSISHNRDEWFLGSCIGKINQKGKPTIKLMKRTPLWLGFSNLNSNDEDAFMDDHTYTLTAYETTDEVYSPLKIFDLEVQNGGDALRQWAENTRNTVADSSRYCAQLAFDSRDAIWGDNPLEEECFILDNTVLLVPYKQMDGKVDIAPFKYDGRHFKVVKPEETKPIGSKLGTISMKNTPSIYLVDESGTEPFSTNIPGIGWISNSVKAYHMLKGLYIPASIFPYHEKAIKYLPGDEPFSSSNPNHGFSAFDSTENKVYTTISERTSMGGWGCFDRYEVYWFNGEEFIHKGEDGGYWLHPSLRKFGRLLELSKSKDYLVRIDEMRSYDSRGSEEDYEAQLNDTCRFRYAAWKHKDNMLDAPNLVILDGYDDGGTFVFYNDGYKYEVDDELRVYKGDKLILKQDLESLIPE